MSYRRWAFVSGGYRLIDTYGNLRKSQCLSGNSGGFITTVITHLLPPSARITRWQLGSDSSIPGVGWAWIASGPSSEYTLPALVRRCS
jgi:hypothetical protein